VRGPIVFQGYHKQPGETAQVLDAQGWLHTGDIGERLPGGHLRLIDRCEGSSCVLCTCKYCFLLSISTIEVTDGCRA
jgi:acyl-CoA synthetase (AMP-forming)/AMP-acid ligase II